MQVRGTHVRFYRPGIRVTVMAAGLYATVAIAGRSGLGHNAGRFLEWGGVVLGLLLTLYVIVPIIAVLVRRRRPSAAAGAGIERRALATENGQQLIA